MAKPLAGVAGHGQATCRGGHLWPSWLQEQSTAFKAPCKGAVGFPQATARRYDRQRLALQPAGATTPTIGVVAP
ncbi:hypothetical protein BHE74_00058788 [Ensete ventricosum]|nr:hypothetical protein BHE74_00058788 [Ensete ventricosum]